MTVNVSKTSSRRVPTWSVTSPAATCSRRTRSHKRPQRWLEVIGEAAARLSPAIRERHRDVAWQEVIGMRNILAHGYFDIDVAIVWQAICDDIPHLREQVEVILTEL